MTVVRALFFCLGIGSAVAVFSGEVVAEIQSVFVRTNDVIDVAYSVRAENSPTVGAFLIAYEDGKRSVQGVCIARSFVDGTASNVGTSVAANVTHKLSWRADVDKGVCLGKLKVEVLAADGVESLVPLSCVRIPIDGEFILASTNTISEGDFFNALLWLYAAGKGNVHREGDVLKSADVVLARGTNVTEEGVEFVYSEMGYGILTGADLDLLNRKMRLELSPQGIRQYALRRAR